MSDRVPYLTSRLQGFGTTIFAEMSALATRTGAINLGQGFPDYDGPAAVLDTAVAAIRSGHNQYPPGRGVPALREAIARHQRRFYGLGYDPDTEVLVTAGATEAIAAACLALCEPGDEVVVLEPTYDSYQASIAMAGAMPVFVTLRPPAYRLDVEALRGAVTPRTRLLLVNSPHNPTGTVLDRDELAAVAAVAVEHDLVVVTDEVYEHLVFDGLDHVPLASLPGMRDRTVTISSGGKTFNTTGWKIGWICAPAPLVTAVTTAKQFLTYVNGGPFQPAVAAGLDLPDDYFTGIAADLAAKRDVLCDGLDRAGFTVFRPQGTYFVTVDIRPLRDDGDGMAFCRELPERCGVVAIPNQVFYAHAAAGRHLVRFSFAKRHEVLHQAVARLARLRSAAGVTTGAAEGKGAP
ncbi:MAG TPA: pyridoxal phosphate-dependent aminotransferase [Acidimicrobiales bacterium]